MVVTTKMTQDVHVAHDLYFQNSWYHCCMALWFCSYCRPDTGAYHCCYHIPILNTPSSHNRGQPVEGKEKNRHSRIWSDRANAIALLVETQRFLKFILHPIMSSRQATLEKQQNSSSKRFHYIDAICNANIYERISQSKLTLFIVCYVRLKWKTIYYAISRSIIKLATRPL